MTISGQQRHVPRYHAYEFAEQPVVLDLAKFAEFRKFAEVTLEQIAAETGVTRSGVHRWQSRLASPRPDVFRKLMLRWIQSLQDSGAVLWVKTPRKSGGG